MLRCWVVIAIGGSDWLNDETTAVDLGKAVVSTPTDTNSKAVSDSVTVTTNQQLFSACDSSKRSE